MFVKMLRLNPKIQHEFSNFSLYFTHFSHVFCPTDGVLPWLREVTAMIPPTAPGSQIQATEQKEKLKFSKVSIVSLRILFQLATTPFTICLSVPSNLTLPYIFNHERVQYQTHTILPG